MASLGISYLLSDDSDDPKPEFIPETQPNPIPDSPTIPTPTVPSTNQIPLPPLDQTYETSDKGKDAINDFIRPYGYTVTSRRSITRKGVKKTVYLRCDRGFKPPSEDRSPPKKRPNTTTMANECPLAITLRLDRISGRWRLTVENNSHNHEPSPPSTHPAQRALELKHKQTQVDNALNLGRSTRQVLIELYEDDPDTALKPRDLYNKRWKLNQMFLAGRTPIQALLEELPKDGIWIFRYELDDQDHVTALFCMHKTSVSMLQRHPWVISIDSTYKTNCYGLPLLDIVGFAPTGQSFHIGFAFMRDELKETYEVMLHCLAGVYEAIEINPPYPRTILTDKEKALYNSIEIVFPDTKHMICLWHINQNLMKVR